MHTTRGITVAGIEGDREFACLTHDLLPTPTNTADADDHVSEVERSIRTVKERTRCLVHGLPYKRLPRVMIRSGLENSKRALNQLPVKGGVSKTMSPLTIMTGKPLPDYNDMKIEFGAYVQVYEANNPTNTMKARTTGAIALAPTGNAQGGYYFMSLVTARQQWDELPMPEGVIAAVEAMVKAEDQPIIGPGGPLFEWAQGVPIKDDIEVPILQDENEVEIVDVITAADDDEGTDDDFDNGELAPESSGEEDDEDAEEVNMEQNEPEVAEHVENEDGGHVHDEDYELDVEHDEYEDELESVSDEDDPLGRSGQDGAGR
jgi:hypothetical protein